MYRSKLLTALLAFIAILGLEAATAAQKATVVFTWWYIPGYMDEEPEWADQFRAEHPEIDFKVEPIAWGGGQNYMEKLVVRIASDVGPDVAQIPQDVFMNMAAQGMFAELGRYLDSWKEISLDDYIPGVWEAVTYKGRVLALPEKGEGFSVQGIQYKPQVFEDAGVVDPNTLTASGDWNWNTLRQVARKVHKVDAEGNVEIYGLLQNLYGIPIYMEAFLAGAGADLYDEANDAIKINTPHVKQALQFIQTMILEDRSSNGPGTDIYNGYLFPGKYAMWCGPLMSVLPKSKGLEELDFAIQPEGSAGQFTAGELTLYCMFTSAKEPVAAASLLRFFARPPTREEVLESGRYRLPVHVAAMPYAVERYEQYGYGMYKYLPEFVMGARTGFLYALPQQIQQVWGTGINRIFSGQAPLEATLMEMDRQINALWDDLSPNR